MKKQNNSIKNNRPQQIKSLNPKKKILFAFILALIPVIIFLIIELFLRVIHYGDNYDLFVEFNFYGKEYKKCNPDFGKKYFYHFQNTSPANDIFLKKKPENGFRIFVIGSSTVYGFPYSSGVMFSRILHERLEDSYPEKNIEIINTAITAVNSFTFQDKINDILKEEPDAILIYAGHNEFYGALGIGSKEGLGQIRSLKILHLKLLEFKTYQLIRNMIFGIGKTFIKQKGAEDPASATLMERIVSNKSITYKSKIYSIAHKHYYRNMNSILKKAKNNNIPVIISEVISNVKDLKPFCSAELQEYPPAIEVYEEAKKFKKNGEYKKAKTLYYQAKDLDCIRFRASEEINEIIRELAIQHGACIVPMKSVFENASSNYLIGNDLLTEHVHPNIDGYFLMADAFYNTLTKNKIIGELDSSNYTPSSIYRNNWGFTELDSMIVDLKIRQLTGGWPFKSDTIINSFIYEYKPVSFIDSLAYQNVRYDDISLEIVHKKLAKYYILHEIYEKAYNEYYSLIKIDPYNIKNYIEAGEVLMKIQKYEKALKLFLTSQNIKEDIYTLTTIGELFIKIKEFDKAVSYLEKVRKTNPEFLKQKVLELLYEGYKGINDSIKANEILSELSTLKEKNENKENIIIYTPESVQEYIDQAIKLLKANKLDEALDLLYKSNKIQETSIANRFIGEILLHKKDINALSYLKKAYYEYNSDPNFLNTLCYASISFKDITYAEKILVELKQLVPSSPNIKKYEDAIAQIKN